MVVEGPADNTCSLVRKMVGATKVDDAEPGTIRGDFATITTENLVHASDSHESAARQIALWFPARSASERALAPLDRPWTTMAAWMRPEAAPGRCRCPAGTGTWRSSPPPSPTCAAVSAP